MGVTVLTCLLAFLAQSCLTQDGWPEWPEWPAWVDSTGWPEWPEWPEWTDSSENGASNGVSASLEEAAVTVEPSEGLGTVAQTLAAPEDISLGTVAQALAASEDLSFFYETAIATGLIDLFEQQDYTATIFVPTNNAMASALGMLGYMTFAEFTENMDKADSIATYHIVPEANIFSTDLVDGVYVNMLTSQVSNTKVDLSDGVKIIGQGSEANVVEADIVAGNSVIHVIDTVLLPFDPVIEKEVNEALSDLGEFKSINDAVENVPSLSTFGTLVEAAGLTPTILTQNYRLTIFIPSNDAFNNLLMNLEVDNLEDLLKSVDLLQQILLTHFVAEPLLLQDLESDQELITAYGGTVTINGYPFLTVVSDGAAAKVLNFDIFAEDVTIFIIDDVLLPWEVTDEYLEEVQNVVNMDV